MTLRAVGESGGVCVEKGTELDKCEKGGREWKVYTMVKISI